MNRLRLRKAAPIEPSKSRGDAHSRLQSQRMPGVKMRLIGWAIALAAAGLTPAAAQPPPSTTAPTAAAQPATTPPAGTAQDATKPDAAQPAVVPGSIGHMIPTPGIGE